MRTSIRRSTVMALVATFMAIATFFDAAGVSAICPDLVVYNLTNATIVTTLRNAGGETLQITAVGFGTTTSVGRFVPAGAIPASGFYTPFNPGGGPCFGCTPCLQYNTSVPGTKVCAFVCYDPSCCILWVLPCPSPC